MLYGNLEKALPAIGVNLSEAANHALVGDMGWLTPFLDTATHYLDTLGVTPSYRGKGLAKVMLNFAKEETLRNNCEGMLLLARAYWAPLYTEYGFELQKVVEIGAEEFHLMYQSTK